MDEPKVTQTDYIFARTCAGEVDIRVDAATIWRLLTDAEGFPRWNSTVRRIEGRIAEGERLTVRVPGTDRTFTPRVSDVVAHERMTWAAGGPRSSEGCAPSC
jgi:uncharacterized protein YndB with AHSA1/START domain